MTPTEFKAIRKAAGFTQAQMAERLDVSRRTVISWEAGEFSLPHDIAAKLAGAGLAKEKVAEKPVDYKTHPALFKKIGPDIWKRTHLHPHWYLRCTALTPHLTKEQQDQAAAFVTMPSHVDGHTPMTGEAAVAFLCSFGMEEPRARAIAQGYGFQVAGVPPSISDADLVS